MSNRCHAEPAQIRLVPQNLPHQPQLSAKRPKQLQAVQQPELEAVQQPELETVQQPELETAQQFEEGLQKVDTGDGKAAISFPVVESVNAEVAPSIEGVLEEGNAPPPPPPGPPPFVPVSTLSPRTKMSDISSATDERLSLMDSIRLFQASKLRASSNRLQTSDIVAPESPVLGSPASPHPNSIVAQILSLQQEREENELIRVGEDDSFDE